MTDPKHPTNRRLIDNLDSALERAAEAVRGGEPGYALDLLREARGMVREVRERMGAGEGIALDKTGMFRDVEVER